MKQLKPLWLKRNAQPTYTRDIAAGSVHPGDEAVPHRATAGLKNDRYHRGSRFCRETRSGSADSNNHRNLVANQITRQVRQSIILPLRPAVFDRYVLALDVACFLQALAERDHEVRGVSERGAAQETNNRHRRLLRPRREWPRGRRAAEQRDEFAPVHSITSSARASSVGDKSRPSALAF